MDICVWDTGRVTLLSGGTVAGQAWLRGYMPTDIQRWGICSYAVVHDRVAAILWDAARAGMSIEVEA